MNRKFAVTAGVVASVVTAHGAETAGWQPLFNGKNLDGWSALIGKGPNPEKIPADHVVVRDEAIHMFADVPAGQQVDFGTMYHEKVFSRFHLSLEYAWGKKKFAPRNEAIRDAGLLYHMPDRPQARMDVWPTSVECQIQEGDTGDIVMIDTQSFTWGHPDPGKAPEGQGKPGMLPEDGGVPILTGRNEYVGRYPVADQLDGWNTVEAIVQADGSAVHRINGVLRSRLALTRGPDGQPLKSGKIGIQLEGAEILYRNIRVKELPEPLQTAAPYASMSTVKGISTGEAEIIATNPSKQAVPLEMKLVGKDAASFRIESMEPNPQAPVVIEQGKATAWTLPDGGKSLEPGASVSLRVKFLPTGKAGRYSAGLQIGPDDTGTFVILQGLASDALEGENEPPLERIVRALGIPLHVGGSGLKLGTQDAVIGASKPATRFRKAGEGAVKMTAIARYSPPGAYPFGWQAGGPEQVVGSLADSDPVADAHQRLFPPLADGAKSVEFSPGDEAFGLFVHAGKHRVGTDKEQHPSSLANPTRVFPIQVFQGRRVTDAFLVGFEEASNGDYQDCLFLVENVRIAE